MGRQINFYLYPDDYQEFEDLLKACWSDSIIKTARRKLKKYKFDMGGWGFSEYVGKHTKEWLDKTKQEKQINDSTLVTT